MACELLQQSCAVRRAIGPDGWPRLLRRSNTGSAGTQYASSNDHRGEAPNEHTSKVAGTDRAGTSGGALLLADRRSARRHLPALRRSGDDQGRRLLRHARRHRTPGGPGWACPTGWACPMSDDPIQLDLGTLRRLLPRTPLREWTTGPPQSAQGASVQRKNPVRYEPPHRRH